MLNCSINSKQTIFSCNGKSIGFVKNKVFFKSVRKSRHMLRKPLGWASDIESLEQAEKYGALHFQINDLETGKIFIANIQDFWDFGLRINRGYGEQIVLTLRFWETFPREINFSSTKTQKPPKVSPLQMRLPI
jgi:hypothetical protein